MKKILTIFERDWEGSRKVVPTWISGVTPEDLATGLATEKIDGTNVRVTIRNHTAVRLEKRRNPSKQQKAQGISEPWYVDANPEDKADQYLFEALHSTSLAHIPDGEWSAEAYGEKIQGNELGLEGHRLFFFSVPGELAKITFSSIPLEYGALNAWLQSAESLLHPGHAIEGLVWHLPDGRMYKIKRKDFPRA